VPSTASLDQLPDPFDLWSDLKINTRLRLAMWLRDGLPAVYGPIDWNITIGEHAATFRAVVVYLGASELRDLKALVREQLRIEGYKDLKIPGPRDDVVQEIARRAADFLDARRRR